MTRLEKCQFLKEQGYTYDPDTGKIYGTKGFEIKRKQDGYICIGSNYFKGSLKGHHFAYYMIYGNVDFERLDHKNTNRSDNRIDNLRILTNQQNLFNTNAKGYTWNKTSKKWEAQIGFNNKNYYLGVFKTEEEARNAYLEAKKLYHKFD